MSLCCSPVLCRELCWLVVDQCVRRSGKHGDSAKLMFQQDRQRERENQGRSRRGRGGNPGRDKPPQDCAEQAALHVGPSASLRGRSSPCKAREGCPWQRTQQSRPGLPLCAPLSRSQQGVCVSSGGSGTGVWGEQWPRPPAPSHGLGAVPLTRWVGVTREPLLRAVRAVERDTRPAGGRPMTSETHQLVPTRKHSCGGGAG